jgi:hypothetical protein
MLNLDFIAEKPNTSTLFNALTKGGINFRASFIDSVLSGSQAVPLPHSFLFFCI